MSGAAFVRLLRSEWFKLIRRRMTWILAGLLVGLTLLLYVALTLGVTGSSMADADQETIDELETLLLVSSIPPFGDDIVWQLVSIMGVILISSSIGNEFSWRTIVTLVAWTGDRVLVIAAKLVVNTLLTVLGVVAGFLACIGSAVTIGTLRGTFEFEQLTGNLLTDIGLAMLTTLVTALPYIFFAATITILGRSAALGISVGLAWLFLEGLGVMVIDTLGESFSWAKNVLMNWNVQAVLDANGYIEGISSSPEDDLPSAWQGFAVLLLHMAGYIITSIVVFARRDITE